MCQKEVAWNRYLYFWRKRNSRSRGPYCKPKCLIVLSYTTFIWRSHTDRRHSLTYLESSWSWTNSGVVAVSDDTLLYPKTSSSGNYRKFNWLSCDICQGSAIFINFKWETGSNINWGEIRGKSSIWLRSYFQTKIFTRNRLHLQESNEWEMVANNSPGSAIKF